MKLKNDELKRGIAIFFVIGLNHQPQLKLYWNLPTTLFGMFGSSFVQRTMSRNKFFAKLKKHSLSISNMLQIASSVTLRNIGSLHSSFSG
jgi:hypothetical protein